MDTIIQNMGNILGNQVYIKREDLIPFSFGGNKARKAQLFFHDIDEKNCDCVVTYGSSSSNHCRIVSNMAAMRKMECFIISPEESSMPTFNSKIMDILGADITFVPVNDVHDAIEDKMNELIEAGKKPYFIEGGGHGNIGTEAYVRCYDEICRQEKQMGTFFDYIFFASGTGTTHAGLVCGQLMKGNERKIIGISIARKNPRGRKIVIESIQKYLSEKGIVLPDGIIQKAVCFDDHYIGHGYADDNQEIQNVIKNMLLDYGIPMDSTYVGKAFWGMENYISEQKIVNKNILFIHTGGTPLFFDSVDNLFKFSM